MWSLIWALVGCVVMFILGRVNSPMFISIAIKNYYDDTPLTPPTPGNVYMIVEATTGKAVTVAYGVPYLQHIKDNNNEYTHWMCTEANNYYGFFNEASGKYLGHNGYGEIRASAETMLDWEYFTVRWHDNGGYQLLTPYWHHQLWSVDVAEDGRRLQRRVDGSTLWHFVKVSE